jgi:hypothetical protein
MRHGSSLVDNGLGRQQALSLPDELTQRIAETRAMEIAEPANDFGEPGVKLCARHAVVGATVCAEHVDVGVAPRPR